MNEKIGVLQYVVEVTKVISERDTSDGNLGLTGVQIGELVVLYNPEVIPNIGDVVHFTNETYYDGVYGGLISECVGKVVYVK